MNTSTLLSAPQLDIYAAQQVAGDKPVYSMPVAFRLIGALDRAVLEEALAEIVKRHDSLRSEIVPEGSEPRQSVRPFDAFRLGYHEISQPSAASASSLNEKLRALLSVPFRLRRELPFRADLLRVAPEEHLLVIQLHHLFGDMASLAVICRELGVIYSAKIEGRADFELPEPAGRRPTAAAAIASPADLHFWKEALSGCSNDFELPLDKKRPHVPTFNGDAVIHELPEALHTGVLKLGRELKCSAYMVLLAAFETLLYRYTGEQHFSLATPFSDRMEPSDYNIVGYLSRLLPAPCALDPQQSFSRLVQSGREAAIDAFSHSNISFRQLIQQLQSSAEGARPALARIVFQYHPEVLELRLSGLKCEPVHIHNGTSKFDLCVSIGGIGGDRRIELEFDTDLFERTSIERFARCYETLLQDIVRDPKKTLQSLEIIPPEDKRLLQEWNATATSYPADATVHSLFEEQARLHPDRIALRAGNRRLTYAELNQLADNVAANLREAGVQPESLVGVCIKRSPELIAALLGILKAGAAFVPFDAAYPQSRLQYLFDDSSVRLLVIDEAGRGLAPDAVQTCAIGDLMASPARAPRIGPTAHSLSRAYIMYTSGSTGNPKGVVVPHRAIVRLVKNNDFMSISEDDVFLAFAPVSFDASTLEIWAPLLNGATLAIYPSEFESTEQFTAVLKEHGVTVLWLTSALFNTIADQDIQSLSGIRQLLVGGDVLSVAHIRKALQALPQTRIINGYGPTENTTFTCCYTIPRDWPEDRSIPIGKPIRNTTVHILDSALQPVPIGVVGDLYAGGDGLSLGYWNKPDLTAASFIRNPFSSDPAARLYRTGDRARFLPDGNVEFLGRKDAQVKIRGFRIELGEVENAFRSFPGVRDVVATVHTAADSSKTLVAYVIPEANTTLDASELLRCAREVLPSHSVPSFVTILEKFPLGPTGKVDRRALPPPEPSESAARIATPAKNSVEQKILEIWQMILGVETVGVDDSFFDLGGESLRATRAVNQLNKTFDCRLAMSSIFRAPTAREMANLVSRQRVAGSPIRN
jgi:amino acid adenylation domain-containing protein